MLEKISSQQLSEALEIKQRIERLEAELSQVLGGAESQLPPPEEDDAGEEQ